MITDIAEAADEVREELLTPDAGCKYDRLIEIDLDTVRNEKVDWKNHVSLMQR